jgi:hypothetical protein
MSQPSDSTTVSDAERGTTLGATLLRVAWFAIILGLVIETVLLVLAAGFGDIPGIKEIAVDLVQKISWSVIVCVGLAFGKAASKSQPAWTGLSGLFAAPVTFSVAGTLHKSASYALHLPAGSGFIVLFLLALLKGLEYGTLGWLLARVGKKPGAGAGAYAGVGFVVGLVFGTVIVYTSGSNRAVLAVLPEFINEVLYPIGCSLALFAADVLGKRAGK